MPDAPLTASRGPWVGGYTSAVPAFMARPDQLVGNTDGSDTNSSRDCFIDPFTGGVSKRPGSVIMGDTVDGSGIQASGIYNTNAAVKTRQLFAIDSPSLDDGYPTIGALFGLDTNAGFPSADVGFPGSLYVRSTNSGATTDGQKNYTLLEEFSDGNTYSSSPSGSVPASSGTVYRMKIVPIWYESGDGVYMRGAIPAQQVYAAAGSRNVLQTQNWMYAPNLRATPWRWNKRFSETSSIGTSTMRIYPTGPFAPLWPPQKDTLPSATNGSSWVDGDTYYISVMFQFEDGSYSLPFIPRPIQASGLTSGLGLVTVGSVGGTNKYPYVPYKNIPLGPEGTVARILLRSPKQNRTAATDTVTVSPLDLRIIGVLRNNTQKTYNDYGGDDDSLLEDADVVRFDYVCPRRSRYIGTGDQRVLISYTLPNTAAIMLAPCGINANYDRNHADTDSNCYGNTGSYVRITSTDLELHYNAGAAPVYDTAPTYSGTPGGNAVKFPFATYTTLETLVDAINASTFGSNCRQWAAQLAPGIDGSMPSSSLTLTTINMLCSTNTSTPRTITSSGGFASMGVGHKISGTGITAGTYILSKQSDSSITVSANTTVTGSNTLNFYCDTGDEGFVTGGSAGYIRAFSSTWPVLLHMKPSAFPNYATPDKTSVYFTVSSPGAATTGISLAPNSWVAGNRRLPHASPRQQSARICMGITDIEGAAVVAFNDGIHLFANRRGGTSGEDFDYRLFTINDTRGVVSPAALTSGNGWAAYCTSEGIMVVDKNLREFCISGDIHNPTDGKGDLSYSIGLSIAAAAKDADLSYVTLGVFGSRLAVAVLNQSEAKGRVLFYDFSPGVEASGVEELLNPETKRAYIWSPPAIYTTSASLPAASAMGSVVNASGRLDYVAYDTTSASFSGRIDQIGTTSTDQGTTITSYAVVSPWVASEFMALSPQRMEVTHLRSAATSGTSTLDLANDQTPTFNTSTYTRGLPVNASKVQFQKQVVPIDQAQRGKTDLFWARWRNNIDNTSNRIWRIVLQYAEVES